MIVQVKSCAMEDGEDSALARAVAGALAWWRDAGVDLCFDDEPAHWISPAQSTAIEAERLRHELRMAAPTIEPQGAAAFPVVAAAARGGAANTAPTALPSDAVDLAAMPTDRALFAHWWLTERSLDGGRAGGRIPPRGPIDAATMVIVPEPEAGDDDRLLSGPHGRLLYAILAALGLREDAVYVASALPRHMPIPDWAELADRGFGELLARHVALAAPQRMIAFGAGVRSLLGNSLPQSAAKSAFFAHEKTRIPLFPARGLDALIARPVWKAELWKGLLDWLPTAPDRAGPS